MFGFHETRRFGSAVTVSAPGYALRHNIFGRELGNIRALDEPSHSEVAISDHANKSIILPEGIAPMSPSCIISAIAVIDVSGETHSTPLCIISLTFIFLLIIAFATRRIFLAPALCFDMHQPFADAGRDAQSRDNYRR